MELTPQQLCDVEFSEQWRGYSRDQVDDFIERVAAAVSMLQDRLRKMTERAVRAEQRSLEGTEADGAARRTLVLAQRTADATVAEAKDTAARLIAQAQEEARAIILAAETANETMPSVEPTARAEIADLEVTRSRLQADVAALESHVSDRRARIKDLLDELQRRVDEGLDGRIAQWPSPDERILTGEAEAYGPAAHDADRSGPEPTADDPAADDADGYGPVPDESDTDASESGAPTMHATEADEIAAFDAVSLGADTFAPGTFEPDAAVADAGAVRASDDPAPAGATRRAAVDTTSSTGRQRPFEPQDVEGQDIDDNVDLAPAPPEWEPRDAVPAPPLTLASNTGRQAGVTDDTAGADEGHHVAVAPAPVGAYDEPSARDVDDDTFFAQLRGALDDDAPLGPREDALGVLRWREEAATAVAEAPSLYDQGEPARRKFGRKKRRQR
ncbi:MAG: DivIVA domain-containing protein [Acidimicrobiia bacterium]|nr:DivIVA domain-containing protein [Acidimicrobiia bacterium]